MSLWYDVSLKNRTLKTPLYYYHDGITFKACKCDTLMASVYTACEIILLKIRVNILVLYESVSSPTIGPNTNNLSTIRVYRVMPLAQASA